MCKRSTRFWQESGWMQAVSGSMSFQPVKGQQASNMRTYLLLILRIPSIALLFLPYTLYTSPWATVSTKWDHGLVLLGGSFFLSIPILIAQTRVFLKRPFSKGERAIYRGLACAALAAGFAYLGLGIRESGFSQEDIPMAGFRSVLDCVQARTSDDGNSFHPARFSDKAAFGCAVEAIQTLQVLSGRRGYSRVRSAGGVAAW